MAQVHVCNSTAREPFRSFQDNTVRHVCVPEGEEAACLYVAVEQPGQLTVESDGITLFETAVDPTSTTSVPLPTILNWTKPRPQGSSILLGLRSRLSSASTQKITAFRVIVTKNDPQPNTVAATFTFQLLNPAEYETRYMKYLARNRPVKPHDFVVDWQIPPQQSCWNCHAPVDGPTCTTCGSDQE